MDDAAQSERQAIRDAAIAELIARGIDNFSVEGVSSRAGLDPGVITRIWRDRRVLLMAAQLSLIQELAPTPDTGNLRADLAALSHSLCELAETAQGRTWFQLLLPASGDADLSEVRSDFWRAEVDRQSVIVRRAFERGEVRAGIDPVESMRMFSAACYYDVIFAGSAVRPEYAARVIDIFIHGIAA
jgi:AcrR family transcriptional regulator